MEKTERNEFVTQELIDFYNSGEFLKFADSENCTDKHGCDYNLCELTIEAWHLYGIRDFDYLQEDLQMHLFCLMQ